GRTRIMAKTKMRNAMQEGRGTRRPTGSSAPRTLPSPWITSAPFDLVLFVATPVLILPLIALSLWFARPSELYLYVAAFGALGHHLPGMMRAYGDRALFARFKVRFIVAPAFLVAVCFYFAFTEPKTTIILAYLWSVWHAA